MKQCQYLVKEAVTLTHEAVGGIQHPTIIIQPGKYHVGTTVSSLYHINFRD